MNDKELADKVVALGVLDGGNDQYYAHLGINERHLSAKEFVRDWRVAGALMEKVDSIYPEKLIDERWQVQASLDAMPTEWLTNESLPCAITEACVEALS